MPRGMAFKEAHAAILICGDIQARLMPGAMSGSMALQQLGFVFMSVALVRTEAVVVFEDNVSISAIYICIYISCVLLLWVMVTSGPKLQKRTVSGSMALWQPESILMSIVIDTIKD